MYNPTCKDCYWYAVCLERDRMYPCRSFDNVYEKKGREPHGEQAPKGSPRPSG